jgi:GntR family transcriptional regulator
LQDDGYVTVRRGVGMFVASGAIERLCADERERFLGRVWPGIREHIIRLGIDPKKLFDKELA